MALITESLNNNKSKTRVFNFSFSAKGPIIGNTEVLDQIIFDNDLLIVASAGNIQQNQVLNAMTENMSYPDYLLFHKIYFPGDCCNVITVGSITHNNTTLCKANSPSLFTRSGIQKKGFLKPDVVDTGGNFDIISENSKPSGIIPYGISAPSANSKNKMIQMTGTSFSTPIVASIVSSIEKIYKNSSCLIKSILLSSCDNNYDKFDKNVIGFGKPDEDLALFSYSWRTSFLMEGTFNNTENYSHYYKFYFPTTANLLKISIVVGRSFKSTGYIKYELEKAGNREGTLTTPNFKKGDERNKIYNTYKGIFNVLRGGIGVWKLKITPYFDNNVFSQSLKYGCVIAVESTNQKNVYTAIDNWMKTGQIEEIKIFDNKEDIRKLHNPLFSYSN